MGEALNLRATELEQLLQCRLHRGGVADPNGPVEFDLDQRRGNAGDGLGGRQCRRVAVQQIVTGEVDGDRQRDAAVEPMAQLPADRTDRPAAQVEHRTAACGDLREAVRRDVVEFGIAPAQQRLDADE